MDLNGAEIMGTGDPDGRGVKFTPADLQSIVDSFGALQLQGRVPLRFGHGDEQPFTEGAPALGWVSKLWTEGGKLLANFSDMPSAVYQAIQKGLYKFVSVELLKDVKAGTRSLPWVLDAVALLGADQPAFGNLKDLQSLTLQRNYTGGVRYCFSRNKLEGSNMSESVSSLKTQLVDEIFNGAIIAGRIEPACRERFFRRYGRDASAFTVDDARTWIATEPAPRRENMSRSDGRMTTRHAAGESAELSSDPDQQVIQLAHAKQDEHLQKFGRVAGYTPLSFHDACTQVFRDPTNKEVLKSYFDREHLR